MGTPAGGPDLFPNPFRFPQCPLIRVFGRVEAAGWVVHLPNFTVSPRNDDHNLWYSIRFLGATTGRGRTGKIKKIKIQSN